MRMAGPIWATQGPGSTTGTAAVTTWANAALPICLPHLDHDDDG